MTDPAKRIDPSVIEIIPHPYTYLPAIAYHTDSGVEWLDCHTGQELPPYYGYGTEAQHAVDEWYQNR